MAITGEMVAPPPAVALPRVELRVPRERMEHIARLAGERIKNTNWLQVAKNIPKYYWESINPKNIKDPMYALGLGLGVTLQVAGLNEPLIAGIRMASPFLGLGFHGAKGLARYTNTELEARFGSGKRLQKVLGGMAAASIVGQVGNVGVAVGEAMGKSTTTVHAAELSTTQVSMSAADLVKQPALSSVPSESSVNAVLTANQSLPEPIEKAAEAIGEKAEEVKESAGQKLEEVRQSLAEKLAPPASQPTPSGELPVPTPSETVFGLPVPPPSHEIPTFDRNVADFPTKFDPQYGLSSNPDWPSGKADIYPSLEASHAEAAFERDIAATVGYYLPIKEEIIRQTLPSYNISPAQISEAAYAKISQEIQGVLEIRATEVFHTHLGEITKQAGLPTDVDHHALAQHGHRQYEQWFTDISQLSQEDYQRLVDGSRNNVYEMLRNDPTVKEEMQRYAKEALEQHLDASSTARQQLIDVAKAGSLGPQVELNDVTRIVIQDFIDKPEVASNKPEKIIATIAANYENIYSYIGQRAALHTLPPDFHLIAPHELPDLLKRVEQNDPAALQKLRQLLGIVKEGNFQFQLVNDPEAIRRLLSALKLRSQVIV